MRAVEDAVSRYLAGKLRGESLDDAWTLLDKGRALARKTIRSKESTR
jgi:hypothetical protein